MTELSSQRRRIFVVTPGFEAALLSELPAAWVAGGAATPLEATGIVSIPEPAGTVHDGEAVDTVDPVFARQQLPSAAPISGASVGALAEAAYSLIETIVDAAAGPFTIHAFVPTGAAPGLASRAALVASETLARLRERRRRASRLYLAPEKAAPIFATITVVVQILLVDRAQGWVSAATPEVLPGGGRTVAPWPGGVAPVAEDRLPPSRAYRKLEEAFLWMEDAPRAVQSCVDLGSAPGGWTHTALRRGARVTAVDRAPLQRPLRGDPALTMIVGNAFTYEPKPGEIPVDWLLSDIICEPRRAVALMERWLTRGWCRRMVMTVKFKGQGDYAVTAQVRELLERAGCPTFRIKHLHHNKNEVTVMAFTTAPPGQAKGSLSR